MTETAETAAEENTSVHTVESLQAELEARDISVADLNKQLDAVKGHSDKLLSEAKAAKKKAKDASEAKELATMEKAKADGNMEQLFNSSESKRLGLEKELQELQNKISKEQLNNVALKLAGEMAEGHNAELLSTFLGQRIKVIDGETKVLDKAGDLTVSSLQDLKNEFTSDDRYKALLRGTKSTGGGANGAGANSVSGTGKNVMSRSAFDKLDAKAQNDHMTGGGILTNAVDV